MTPPFKNLPLALRLILMLSLFGFSLVLMSALAVAIPFLANGGNLHQILDNIRTDFYTILFVQGLSSIGGFIGTAILFSYLEAGEFVWSLRLKYLPPVKMVVLAILAIIVSQFFIDFLVSINSKIPLPDSLNFLLKQQETLKALTDKMLAFKSFSRFVWVSIVIALIPAVGEEMFFRGLLLGDMLKAKISPAIAIPVSGLIFAILHVEFQNTLAIWALGCFLGYLYYISGSLWLTIAAHFANNFLAVLLKYLYNIGVLTTDATATTSPWYAVVISLLMFAGCLYIFYKWQRPYTINDELLQNEEVNTMER